MTENTPPVGSIVWVDQTSPDADRIRDFYTEVVGWTPSPVDMGEYKDYGMLPPGGSQPVAGICHALGVNADLPSGWLIYIIVKDLDASLGSCRTLGGKVVAGPKGMGGKARYAVIEDPSGAIAALFSTGE